MIEYWISQFSVPSVLFIKSGLQSPHSGISPVHSYHHPFNIRQDFYLCKSLYRSKSFGFLLLNSVCLVKEIPE